MRPAILLLAVFVAGSASADEVFLKGGGQLSGRIVSRTATTVEVDVGAGRIAVPASSVVRIEEGRSALQEYEERAGKLAAGRRGRLAGPGGLGRGARPRYAGARGLPPGPGGLAGRPARERGARQRAGGRPVGERGRELPGEGLRAVRGGVDHPGRARGDPAREGRRGRPGAASSERREANAREAEARAQEAEARAREAEAEQASEGIPLWYGWGAGPAYWPTRTGRHGRRSPPPAGRTAEAGAEVSAAGAWLSSPRGPRSAAAAAPAQTVDEIVARHVAARGGGRRSAARAHAAHDGPGQRRPRPGGDRAARDRAARPHPHRVRVPGDDGRLRLGRLGRAGASRPSTAASRPSRCRPRTPPLSAEQADIEGPLVDWKAKGHVVELVGSEALPGGPAHQLKVTLKSGAVRRVWVDAATGLVVRRSRRAAWRGREVDVEIVFGDYRADRRRHLRPLDRDRRARAGPRRLRIVVETWRRTPPSTTPASGCRAETGARLRRPGCAGLDRNSPGSTSPGPRRGIAEEACPDMPTPWSSSASSSRSCASGSRGLFERDPIFRELCEDYEVCVEALAGRPPTDDLSAASTRPSSCGSRPSCFGSLHEDAEPPLHRK